MTARQDFIATVQAALGRSSTGKISFEDIFPQPGKDLVADRLKTLADLSKQQRQKLLKLLIERSQPLNLKVAAVPDPGSAADFIAELVRTKEPEWGGQKQVAAWRHPLIDQLDLKNVLEPDGIPVRQAADDGTLVELELVSRHREQVVGSFIGVTSSDYCLADTATLVMRARPGQPRSTSLVPSIHLAVIRLDQILPDLGAFYTVLRRDLQSGGEGLTNNLTFISGPSKTADIELVMVHGAHGPRELHIVVVME